jgi:hypothetical protein
VDLADYVVSYALQINNRCLRYLAECDVRGGFATSPYGPEATEAAEASEGFVGEVHAVYAESLLARDSRRLVSMWALMQPGWKHKANALARHIGALRSGANALTDASSSRRLALRLASLAPVDHEAEAILKVARKLPTEVPLTWDLLNELFAADSHHWRKSKDFKALQDEDIQRRILRNYRKCYRHAALMLEDDMDAWLDKRGDRFHRRVRLTAHQLELLRPGLSDKGKAQLWYLDKMSDTLRTRIGLADLYKAAHEVNVDKATRKLVAKHVEQQIQKMNKRIVRLAEGCFCIKPKRLDVMTSKAVTALGLRAVSLMNKEPVGVDPVTKTSTENAYG